MMGKTGIIILNYNSHEYVNGCINSVLRYNTAPVKFVIVDNGSTAENEVKFLEQIVASTPDAVLLVNQENLGYAQGNNVGLDYFYNDPEVEYVMILNADILFRMDVIPTLILYLDSISDCGLISPLMGEKSGEDIDITCARRQKTLKSIFMQYATLSLNLFGIIDRRRKFEFMLIKDKDLLNEEYFKIGLPSGSCFLTRKTTMQQIGSFDPNTFLYYEEDILAAKLANIGLNNYLVPSLRVRHLGSGSTRKIPRIDIMLTERRSLLYYLKKYTSGGLIYRDIIALMSIITIYFRHYIFSHIK